MLTGYNTDRKETTCFCAASHPDIPVALAGRVSMGIPVFFKPVKMDAAGQVLHQRVTDLAAAVRLLSVDEQRGLPPRHGGDSHLRTPRCAA